MDDGADLLTLRDEREEKDLRQELINNSVHTVFYWLGTLLHVQCAKYSAKVMYLKEVDGL